MIIAHAHTVTLTVLLDMLGEKVARTLTAVRSRDDVVLGSMVYDSHDDLRDARGAILLLVGFAPDDASAVTVLKRARDAGACAVAVKLHGASGQWLTQTAVDFGLALLEVDEAVSWYEFEELVSTAVSGTTPSEDGLRDLFAIADAIAGAVNGAVAIEDLDRHVLAYSNLAHHAVDQLREDGILRRRVPDAQDNPRLYKRLFKSSGAVHFPPNSEDGTLARCAVAVRVGREAIGSIWVIEDACPVTDEAEASLVEASRMAAIHILRLRSIVDVERHLRQVWLRSLLDGRYTTPSAAERFGISPGTRTALMAFVIARVAAREASLTSELSAGVEQYCAVYSMPSICMPVDQTVYVLLSVMGDADRPVSFAHAAATAIGARLGYPVRAAVGSISTEIGRLHTLREEVDDILYAMDQERDTFGPVASAQDAHPQMLLHYLARTPDVRSRTKDPAVTALIAHDSEHGTEYGKTMCAYFSALGDVNTAASSLGVHANTVRYRVRRAKELFSLRLDNGDSRLATWIALRTASHRVSVPDNVQRP